VHDLRALKLTGSQFDGASLGVAGAASGNIDISAKLASALPIYLVVVIGLSLLIMILVFRSLLVPVVATAGFLLSLAAAFGAIVAVYQWGWLGAVFGVHDPGPVLNFAPVILVGCCSGSRWTTSSSWCQACARRSFTATLLAPRLSRACATAGPS